MNSINLRLLDLIQVAEAPVYSAYRWLSRQLGRQLSMAEFFRLLAGMVEDDVVRLWAVDVVTHERSRWNDIPDDLEERYAQIGELDDGFDPFGLSLTLGPAADLEVSPDWEVDFDFDGRRFVVLANPHAVASARQQIRRMFPEFDFVEDSPKVGADRVRITGSVTEQPMNAGGRP